MQHKQVVWRYHKLSEPFMAMQIALPGLISGILIAGTSTVYAQNLHSSQEELSKTQVMDIPTLNVGQVYGVNTKSAFAQDTFNLDNLALPPDHPIRFGEQTMPSEMTICAEELIEQNALYVQRVKAELHRRRAMEQEFLRQKRLESWQQQRIGQLKRDNVEQSTPNSVNPSTLAQDKSQSNNPATSKRVQSFVIPDLSQVDLGKDKLSVEIFNPVFANINTGLVDDSHVPNALTQAKLQYKEQMNLRDQAQALAQVQRQAQVQAVINASAHYIAKVQSAYSQRMSSNYQAQASSAQLYGARTLGTNTLMGNTNLASAASSAYARDGFKAPNLAWTDFAPKNAGQNHLFGSNFHVKSAPMQEPEMWPAQKYRFDLFSKNTKLSLKATPSVSTLVIESNLNQGALSKGAMSKSTGNVTLDLMLHAASQHALVLSSNNYSSNPLFAQETVATVSADSAFASSAHVASFAPSLSSNAQNAHSATPRASQSTASYSMARQASITLPLATNSVPAFAKASNTVASTVSLSNTSITTANATTQSHVDSTPLAIVANLPPANTVNDISLSSLKANTATSNVNISNSSSNLNNLSSSANALTLASTTGLNSEKNSDSSLSLREESSASVGTNTGTVTNATLATSVTKELANNENLSSALTKDSNAETLADTSADSSLTTTSITSITGSAPSESESNSVNNINSLVGVESNVANEQSSASEVSQSTTNESESPSFTEVPVQDNSISTTQEELELASEGEDSSEDSTLTSNNTSLPQDSLTSTENSNEGNTSSTVLSSNTHEADKPSEPVKEELEIMSDALEKASRLGLYGGGVQTALMAGSSTVDLVNARMGVKSLPNTIQPYLAQSSKHSLWDTMSSGLQMWVSPVYRHQDLSALQLNNSSYGADINLYGLAIGSDYTLQNGVRFGAALNVGEGDVKGQGLGNGVSNDFDYYSFALYGGYKFKQFSLIGDLTYAKADNQFDALSEFSHISASMDSRYLSFGVTGQYVFELAHDFSIAPHVGFRYTNIELSNYNLLSLSDRISYDLNHLDFISFPIGITFAQTWQTEKYYIKPAIDFTAIFRSGDSTVDGDIIWDARRRNRFPVYSEVVDGFAYNISLGLSAGTSALNLGLSFNYIGESNSNEYSINTSVRWAF